LKTKMRTTFCSDNCSCFCWLLAS